MSDKPKIDRAFAEKFMTSVDSPLDYGVYFLFHDFWEGASQRAIDEYMEELHGIEGAKEFLEGASNHKGKISEILAVPGRGYVLLRLTEKTPMYDDGWLFAREKPGQ